MSALLFRKNDFENDKHMETGIEGRREPNLWLKLNKTRSDIKPEAYLEETRLIRLVKAGSVINCIDRAQAASFQRHCS